MLRRGLDVRVPSHAHGEHVPFQSVLAAKQFFHTCTFRIISVRTLEDMHSCFGDDAADASQPDDYQALPKSAADASQPPKSEPNSDAPEPPTSSHGHCCFCCCPSCQTVKNMIVAVLCLVAELVVLHYTGALDAFTANLAEYVGLFALAFVLLWFFVKISFLKVARDVQYLGDIVFSFLPAEQEADNHKSPPHYGLKMCCVRMKALMAIGAILWALHYTGGLDRLKHQILEQGALMLLWMIVFGFVVAEAKAHVAAELAGVQKAMEDFEEYCDAELKSVKKGCKVLKKGATKILEEADEEAEGMYEYVSSSCTVQ
eukprot:TRINITY_DN8769_c0_g1_i1.p1 TRINITY_DN8769_c0_g1~~TRINITY_DN8769_c0_g1_i1.p1  ORF type:complete len:315 (-),score=56.55 TRINITY_DN8769_c0_g1_i1:266-1210(-)